MSKFKTLNSFRFFLLLLHIWDRHSIQQVFFFVNPKMQNFFKFFKKYIAFLKKYCIISV
nr:MAG TPA: hypothetical protein [Caudoviricetes sp.]